MNKQSILWALLDLVFVIIFNIVFFVLAGMQHQPSVWISYGFIHFAYLMVLLVTFFTRKRRNAVVFGFALYSISAVYFFVEFVIGCLFIIAEPSDMKAALVIQVILAGAFLALFLSHLIANEKTAEATTRQEAEVSYIMDAATRLKEQLGVTGDKQTDAAIEKAYDVVKTSPSRSDPSVSRYELAILDAISGLEAATASHDLQAAKDYADQVLKAANSRKQRLRLVQQ